MFFSFEGIDGSGKSTQARLLGEALRTRGYEVVEVREPGGTDIGERIRALLLDPDETIVPRAELLLFSAARAQLVELVISPALARGAVVIADRFFDSSTAYQGAGRGLADPEWMAALHAFATGGMSPHRTYLVDLSPDDAATRRGDREADRMESGGKSFYDRIRSAYQAIADTSPQRVVVLDGTHSIERLHSDILSRVLADLR